MALSRNWPMGEEELLADIRKSMAKVHLRSFSMCNSVGGDDRASFGSARLMKAFILVSRLCSLARDAGGS